MPVNRDSSVPINFNPRRFTRLRMDGLNKTRSVDLFKIVQNFHNQAVRIELPVPDCPGIKLYLNWHTMDPALLEIGIEDHGSVICIYLQPVSHKGVSADDFPLILFPAMINKLLFRHPQIVPQKQSILPDPAVKFPLKHFFVGGSVITGNKYH